MSAACGLQRWRMRWGGASDCDGSVAVHIATIDLNRAPLRALYLLPRPLGIIHRTHSASVRQARRGHGEQSAAATYIIPSRTPIAGGGAERMAVFANPRG